MTTLAASGQETFVGMGQIAVGRAPERMKAVLGSCIGLAIYHPRLKAGTVAHIVLADSAGRGAGTPGKFADTAVPEMLRLLKELGVPAYGLVAKFAGGANMFGGSGPLQIGDVNAKAVTQILMTTGIPAAGQDVGGTKGRRITFDCTTGKMTVECVGKPACSL